MGYILIGTLSFMLLFLFDYFTLKNNFFFKLMFGLGGVSLFIYSNVRIYQTSEVIEFSPIVTYAFGGLALIFFLLLLYSLFIEIPFKKTYGASVHNRNVVDTGTYALCRHPGVLWLFFLYICVFLATGRSQLFLAGFILSTFNVFYVILQEIFIFPKMFDNYDIYQTTTPLLIPTLNSFKMMMMKTLRGK